MEKGLQKLVKDGTRLLKLVQMHPDTWAMNELSSFRDLAYKVTGDPVTYQPPVVEKAWSFGIENLTINIGNCLYDPGLPILQMVSNIVVQITHAKSKMQSTEIDNISSAIRQWRFMGRDGDGTSIPLRVDTSLTSAANLLAPGTVILIESFIPIHFKYDDHNDERCAVIIKKFEVRGFKPLPENSKCRPTKRAKMNKETK